MVGECPEKGPCSMVSRVLSKRPCRDLSQKVKGKNADFSPIMQLFKILIILDFLGVASSHLIAKPAPRSIPH